MALIEDAERTRSGLIDRLGMHPPLFWGYVGLLIFMIGDGVESGFLSLYLMDHGFSKQDAAWVFTAYGLTAAIAAWLSGAISDLWGPRRVMAVGLAIWVLFHVAFLQLGVRPNNHALILGFYAIRGFGYPLFAYGFLVWITVTTPRHRLGTAVGWFWFALTGGLMALGALLASYAVPWIGAYETLWLELGLVIIGGLIALLGVREPTGRRRLAPPNEAPLRTLLSSVSIAREKPKLVIGCVVRIINTAPQYGFLVFLPLFFTQTIGFERSEWLRLLSYIFVSNIFWNLLFGVIGDRFGWRRTVALCGGLGSAITTLLLYYTPLIFGASFSLSALAGILYGATLAGYVPLSALMPSLAPENKAAAVSILNLGAGASQWVGPAIVGIFLPLVGVGGVMWIFAILYLVSAVLTLTLPSPIKVAPTPLTQPIDRLPAV